MKYLLKDKRTNRVSSYSDSHPGKNFDPEKFDVVEIKNADGIDKGFPVYLEGDSLKIIDTPGTIKEKQNEEILELLEKAKNEKTSKDTISGILSILERMLKS